MAKREPEIDPTLAVAGLIIVLPFCLWLFAGSALSGWGLRTGFFTTQALLGMPGATPTGTGPTLTTWTIILATLAAVATGAYLVVHLAPMEQRNGDIRRSTISAPAALVAAAGAAYALVAMLATVLLPQPIPAALGAAAAAAVWMTCSEPLHRHALRQQLRSELEWQLLRDLGHLELPQRCIVTVTKWTTDELPEPDDLTEHDPGAVDAITRPDVPERAREFTLRFSGRRADLPQDIKTRISRAARGRFALTWDLENQLITASAADAEPASIARLRTLIAGPRLLKAGAVVKDIATNPGGEITAFTVRHRIADELAGNEAATALIERRLSQLLPNRWRASLWDHTRDLAKFELRPELPKLVYPDISGQPINTTLKQVCASYGDCKISYAMNEDKQVITWIPKLTPHVLLTGPTGTGKTGAIHTIIAALAHFGFRITIIDFKGMEYNSFKDYPNVVTIVTDVYQAVAVLHKAYKEMLNRYRLGQKDLSKLNDKEPWAIVIDEYTEFQDRLDQFWKAHKPTKNAPRACPTLDEISSILRLGRTARMHVMAGLQRPDATFLKGEARDNFTHRISLGKLSTEAAQMIWGEPWVGRTIPLGIRGRGNARDDHSRPVEVQVFYTPDPASTDPDHQRVISELRPPATLHERRVLLPPPNDPEQMAPSEKFDPKKPVEGDFAYYQGLPLLPAAKYPQIDPLSPHYAPPRWLHVADEGDSFDEDVIPAGYRLPPTPATPDQLVAAQTEGATTRDVPLEDLSIGDYVLVDPSTKTWATVMTEPTDIDEDNQAAFCVVYDITGAEEEVIVSWDDTITVKDLPEWINEPAAA